MVDHNILFKKLTQLDIRVEIRQGIQLMFNNLTIPAGQENLHIGRGLG